MATATRRRRVTGRDFEEESEVGQGTTPRRRRRPEPEDVEEETTDTEDVDTEDEDDEDEDDEPVTNVKKRRMKEADVEDEGDEESGFDSTLIHRGWKATKKAQPRGDWTNDFRFEEDPQIIKFLDNEPWSYNQHWVQREGKKSFPCLGKGCPLCRIGVKLSQKIVFPVVSFGDDGSDPQVMNLQIGPRLADQLETYDADPKVGPLTRQFWAVSRSGKGLKTTYSALPVKERDLEDDWGFDLDEVNDFLADAQAPDPKKAISWPSKTDLQEIADEVMD